MPLPQSDYVKVSNGCWRTLSSAAGVSFQVLLQEGTSFSLNIFVHQSATLCIACQSVVRTLHAV